MGNSAKASAPSVIAAAVVAILGALFSLVIAAIGFMGASANSLPTSSPELPPFLRYWVLGVMVFIACLSLFGIATGVGLLRLRNWARVSVLVWAGAAIFFGASGILVIFVTGFLPAANFPVEGIWLFRLMLAAVYGAPLAVGIWWLILFTRKEIRSQFAREVTPVDLSVPQRQRPRCPVPIVVLAWFLISSAANVVILPFLPFRFPALLFGRVIPGTPGIVIFLLICVLFVVAGVGLLKLKRWSYPLTIGLEFFFLASGIVTAFSPNFDSLMRSALSNINDAVHLPANIYTPLDYTQLVRWGMYFGLFLTIAILVMLFYCRERFLEAAAKS